MKLEGKGKTEDKKKKEHRPLQNMDRLRGVRLRKAYADAIDEAEKEFLHLIKNPAFVAGLSLYWASGTRSIHNRVKFSTADPEKMQIFLRFISGPCKAPKESIRIALLMYPDQDPESVWRFWSFATNVPQSRFYKSAILPRRQKQRKASQGVCTAIVHSTYLRKKLETWLTLLSGELKERRYYENI